LAACFYSAGGSIFLTYGEDSLHYRWSCAYIRGVFCPDGVVDFLDWSAFANAWQSTPLSPNWNSKCDISPDGGNDIVNLNYLAVFFDQWLRPGEYCADIAPAPDGDGIVNMLDFAAFAENWLKGME